MCSPDYFDVTYEINPWMNVGCKVNKGLAKRQWADLKYLVDNFFELETRVIKQKRGLPDMVFSTDEGLVIDNTFVQANFAHDQRKEEVRYYKDWFIENGYKVTKLPKNLYLEGGDFLYWGDNILAGYGFRTSKGAHYKISKLINSKLISLELIDPYLYHLDMAILPLDEETLVYYPKAFSPSSQTIIETLGVRLIKVSRKDALDLTLNSIIHERKMITQQGINGLLVQIVKEGYKVIQTDVSEFKKAGGGIHCLSCCLN